MKATYYVLCACVAFVGFMIFDKADVTAFRFIGLGLSTLGWIACFVFTFGINKKDMP